ncbi:MAG: tetratricopeptide repeat protein [Spirochaetia bacterium]
MNRNRPTRARLLSTVVFLCLAAIAPLEAQENPRALYREGRQALSAGEPFRAVELFTSALEQNPSYADALQGITEAYYELDEYDQALEYGTRYLRNANDLSEARNLLARVHIGLGNLGEAEELYRAVLDESPNNVEARIGTAELAVARDNTETALSRFEEARELAPTNRRVLLSLALVHRYAGRTDAADRYIRLALEHHADSPLVHLLAAEHYLDEDRLEQAAAEADTALSFRPENEDALLLRARIAYLRSNYEEAAQRAEEAIGVNRENGTAWYVRAAALERLERIDDSIETLRLGLRANEEDEFLRIFAEQVVTEELDPDDELRSEFASYHFDRAESFRDENLFSRSRVAYRRGLRVDPYHREGRIGYAQLFDTQGIASKFLQELEVVASFGETDQFLSDRIESYDSALQGSVSRDWGVDQFELERSPMVVDVFMNLDESTLRHPDGAVVYGEYLRDRLVSRERLAVPRPAEISDGFAQAYGSARGTGSDYFVLVTVREDERSIRMEVELYLSRTGDRLESFRSYRTGSEPIERAAGGVVDQVLALMPLRGQLLERRHDRGLITLGSLDGLEVGDELVVVKPGGVMLTTDAPGYRYTESEAVGTLEITALDALVSEGELSRKGDFDFISEGDLIVRASTDEEPAVMQDDSPMFPALYRELRRIR